VWGAPTARGTKGLPANGLAGTAASLPILAADALSP